MSFLSRRVNMGPEGPGRKIRGSSKPPTEVFGFHQTLKKKKRKQKKQSNQRKKTLKPRMLSRGLRVWFERFRNHTSRKKPCDALSTPNVGLNQSRLQALPHERTCAKYFFHELPLGPKDLNQIEEKDKEIPLYGHRHIKGRSNMCSVKPLCFNMKWTKLRIQLKY